MTAIHASNPISTSTTTGHLYRVDRFVVPAAAREEFLARVNDTHEILHTLPGFVRDLRLEQRSENGESVVVTLAEWEGADVVAAAKAVVAGRQRAKGFDPQELIARLGIRAEMGTFTRIEL